MGLEEPKRTKESGLSYWMRRVLSHARRCQKHPVTKTVHDLRVALRRCRTMADGASELDGRAEWQAMTRAARKLLKGLNELRDIQVMRDWLEALAAPDDPVRAALMVRLVEREGPALQTAQQALGKFDAGKWRRWMHVLPPRLRRIPLEGLVLQHLALQRWQEAMQLHRAGLRRRSRLGWHELRLGVKRFRYCVENFLPERQTQWGAQLKRVQDLLGEVHDLDVLQGELRHAGPVYCGALQQAWLHRIGEERQKRITEYLSLMRGKESLWQEWRRGLPAEKQLETAAMAWFRAWAGFRDEHWRDRRRLVTLATQLFDGCAKSGVNEVFQSSRCRRVLYAAALTQNVGRSEGDRGHHKRSYHLIRRMQAPLGWSQSDMLWTALVARYHRGAEPRDNQPGFRELPPQERKSVAWLAAVLRLADGFVSCRPGTVTSLQVESSGGIHIWAAGLGEDAGSLQSLGEKKILLEEVSHRPVLIHAAPLGNARRATA